MSDFNFTDLELLIEASLYELPDLLDTFNRQVSDLAQKEKCVHSCQKRLEEMKNCIVKLKAYAALLEQELRQLDGFLNHLEQSVICLEQVEACKMQDSLFLDANRKMYCSIIPINTFLNNCKDDLHDLNGCCNKFVQSPKICQLSSIISILVNQMDWLNTQMDAVQRMGMNLEKCMSFLMTCHSVCCRKCILS